MVAARTDGGPAHGKGRRERTELGMTIADLLKHWRLIENPFRGEEARLDDVLARMSREDVPARSADLRPRSVDQKAAEVKASEAKAGEGKPADAPASVASLNSGLDHGPAARNRIVHHAEFEKILGDLSRPSSSVVFGEKGSGKTAIRLQIAQRIASHNAVHLGARVLMIPYDDLNGVLDRLHERVGGKTALESLQKIRLVDHLDALLLATVPRVVDAILGRPRSATAEPLDVVDPSTGGVLAQTNRVHKRLDDIARRDLLLLQSLYDYPDLASGRTAPLRRKLRISRGIWPAIENSLAVVGPLIILALVAWTQLLWDTFPAPAPLTLEWVGWATTALGAIFVLWLLKIGLWDKARLLRTAHRIRRQLRVSARGDISYARSLKQLGKRLREADALPLTDSEEPRYLLFDRLRRVLRSLGYAGIVVIVDRVDEPTLVSGDADRMKAVIWPMLNNKFLQQQGVGIKMLLPMELRHALFRESSAFFQEARLDKQNLVDRLGWTGVSLFDLCEARLGACTIPGVAPVGLVDLFEEDVTRQDLIDALDRMHQPRDAFKFLYRCLTEHCATHASDERRVRIPRHIMQSVLKGETDRIQGLYRGIRPA